MKLNINVREIMKGKLYETLIGTDARLAITISGEELKEFIEDVMADARLKAESEIRAKQSEVPREDLGEKNGKGIKL